MDTITFLEKVLPPEGVYVSGNLTPRGMIHGFYDSVEELAQAVQQSSARGSNAYYAVSSMQDKSERSQRNTHTTKSLFIDVDCGPDKPYATWKEGLLALNKFITEVGLPKPVIIHSGNGLHVYWVLTEALVPAQWGPLGLALKAAAKARDFAIDMTVPGDSARLLRPVGTTNPKGGHTVTMLLDAQPVAPDAMRAALSQYVVSGLVSQSNSSTRTSKLAQAVAVESDFPDANADAVVSKCHQIKWGVENQDKVSEPFWYAMLGVAAYCVDPVATAVSWSDKHPDYDRTATLNKMAHWKQSVSGPATCKKFKEERPKGCKDCKFAGKITAPTQIGAQYKEVEIVADVPDKTAAGTPLPRSYKRTTTGIKQTVDGTDVDICPFDIYPVSYGKDEALGYETVRYHWNRQHVGWQELVFRQAYLTDSRIKEFTTAAADQGIVLKTERQTEMFQFMLRTYMDKLREMRAMTNIHNSMGWKEEYQQFILGNDLYRRMDDGTVSKERVTLSSASSRMSNDLYEAAGDPQALTTFTSLMDKLKLYGQMFAMGVSLSAPLLQFTGLNGVTVSLCGPSGTGKTLGQLLAQSLWGDPLKLHFAAKFTPNSLYNRLGIYCNLPMTIDEVTIINNKDIGDFLYMVTQGRDKARLHRTGEEREVRPWWLPVIVSTNVPLSAKLDAMGNATDAQKMRLLELMLDPHPVFSSDTSVGRKIHQLATENYGWIGREFAQYLLAMGPVAVKAMVNDAISSFSKRYGVTFSGEERYWEITIVLADLAMRIAHEKGWFAFDPAAVTDWALRQTGASRESLVADKLDTFDILSEYLNANVRVALTMMHTVGQPPSALFSRMPQGEIRVRYDIMRKLPNGTFDHGTVTIDRTHFKQWLAINHVDYRQMMREFETEGVVVPVKNDKAYLGKGTDIKMGQCYVFALNLSHPRLRGVLEEADQAYDEQVLGQFKVV
jgi:hypothetical protein